jgi:sRNA-binding protein
LLLRIERESNMATNYDRASVNAVIELLAETFPDCFHVYEQRRRPLKIGIHDEILAALGGAVTPGELGAALRIYTSNRVYLRRLTAGTERIGLDGQPAGIVAADEVRPAPKPAPRPTPPLSPPKRLGLSDLRAAAR